MESVWDKTLDQIRKKVSTHSFNTWFKPLKCLSESSDEVALLVPDHFFGKWIHDNYLEFIKEQLLITTGNSMSLSLISAETTDKVDTPPPREPVPSPPSARQLNQKFTFQSFVVGKSNRFAHAAASAVASNPSQSYNPLFICGGVGLGKTHLLHAVGNYLVENVSSVKTAYVTAETYVNEMINALKTNKAEEFRRRYRHEADVLLVDDIQFISGKSGSQEEFFHTFNYLYESGKQIVLTSNQFPQDIPALEDRLRSRFQWGLVADIQVPELETRVAIIKKKADINGVYIPDDVAVLVATHITSNVRELEGALQRLMAFSNLNAVDINLPMAKEVLKKFFQTGVRQITIEDIQKVVCSYFNVKLSDLKSPKRTRIIVFPRQIAMYLSRHFTDQSYPSIGSKFGGRDHSTVVNAVQKITRQLENDLGLKSTIEELIKLIKSN